MARNTQSLFVTRHARRMYVERSRSSRLRIGLFFFFVALQVSGVLGRSRCSDSKQLQQDTLPDHIVSDDLIDLNNPELGDEFEGDMVIPRNSHSRRTFISLARNRWNNGVVPYYLSREFDENPRERELLLSSMNIISRVTNFCIQFYELSLREIEKYPKLPYIYITGDKGRGCLSTVGKLDNDNILNLDVERCFIIQGFSLHELLHALGQIHEHSRPDRDKYITILWDNVEEGKENNFETELDYPTDSFNFPYDYDSITHYRGSSFSKDPIHLKTIVPKNLTAEIGQRTHLSWIDIAKLNLAYNCSEKEFSPIFSIEDVLKNYNLKVGDDDHISNRIGADSNVMYGIRDLDYLNNIFEEIYKL